MPQRFGAPLRRVVAGEQGDRGAAIAEFVMITVLLVFLLFGVFQVAVYFYLRNIVASSAADGARYAASATVAYTAGGDRASQQIRNSLSSGVARDVPCQGSAGRDPDTGLALAVVQCSGNVRSFFLPIGSLIEIKVTARSLKEGTP